MTGRYTKQLSCKTGAMVATTCATTMLFNLVVMAVVVFNSPDAFAKSTDTKVKPADMQSAETLCEIESAKEAQIKIDEAKKAALADTAKKGAHGDGKGATWCTARTTIKAPPEVVWRAVHEERQNDPDIAYSKVLEQNENQFQLEQKFCFIPFLGTSTCVTHQTEVPNQRIDYKLIKSDHFKAMEGSWVLSPSEGGKSTVLEFSSHLDLGLPVPKMLMDGVTSKKMEKRLAHIKQMAEKNHAAIAEKANQTSSLQ